MRQPSIPPKSAIFYRFRVADFVGALIQGYELAEGLGRSNIAFMVWRVLASSFCNLTFYQELMAKLRGAVAEGDLAAFAKRFQNRYSAEN